MSAKRPASSAAVGELPSSLSTARQPSESSVVSTGASTTSAASIPVTSGTAAATSVAAMSKSVDVSAANADRARNVESTGTSGGGTSAMLAQLSYVQPSIELLRQRRAADVTTTTADSQTVSTSTTQGPTHLLSSTTQAALAALASTPRRQLVSVFIERKLL